jgi:sugar-specific transcriptional regulator TrmB
MRQQESYELLLEKLEQFDKEQDEKRRAEWQKKKDYYKALKTQLEDASSSKVKNVQEQQKYKDMIDEIIESIKQEEIQ